MLGAGSCMAWSPPPSRLSNRPSRCLFAPLAVINPLAVSPRTLAAVSAPRAALSLGAAASLSVVEHKASLNLLTCPPNAQHLPAASPRHTLCPAKPGCSRQGRDAHLLGISSS